MKTLHKLAVITIATSLLGTAYAEDSMAKEDLNPLPPEGALQTKDIPPLTNINKMPAPAPVAAPSAPKTYGVPSSVQTVAPSSLADTVSAPPPVAPPQQPLPTPPPAAVTPPTPAAATDATAATTPPAATTTTTTTTVKPAVPEAPPYSSDARSLTPDPVVDMFAPQ